jgi:hypothetical protein
MIPLGQQLLIVEDQSLNLSQLMIRNPAVGRKQDRFKPKLAFARGCPHMNVSGLA